MRNKFDNVLASEAQLILGATKTEFERWVNAGLVPVSSTKDFRKWGKTLTMRLFDPDAIQKLVKKVPAWREKQKKALSKTRRKAAKKAARTRKASPPGVRAQGRPKLVDPVSIHAQRRRESFAVSLSAAFGDEVAAVHQLRHSRAVGDFNDKPLALLRIFQDYRVCYNLELAVPRSVLEDAAAQPEIKVNVAITVGIRESENLALAVLGPKLVRRYREMVDLCSRTLCMMLDNIDRVAPAWSSLVRTRVMMCRPSERDAVLDQIAASTSKTTFEVAVDLETSVDEFVEAVLEVLQRQVEGPLQKQLLRERTQAFQDQNRYDRYPALFPQARAMEREIVFFCGPTNSGKTYEALALAEAATSAEILAPLRLLALEHFESLRDRGVTAGMITGEEEIMPSGATHIARTIETLDTGRVVDVCVIDEIQMIADPSRGWAWTRALIGTPARKIVLTGAPEAIPVVERICELTGEKLVIHHLERKSTLTALNAPISLSKLQPGDAIIAFSRRDVHALRVMVAELGFEVACIYGGLGPEVRRAEAARFAEGKAAVLVATDAIGMGLNLPIRRVLFSTLTKFDGFCRRQLKHGEIRQIGGRAGRFGKSEKGFVGVLSMCERPPRDVSAALASTPVDLHLPVHVCPDRDTVLAASDVIKSDELAKIVSFLSVNLVPRSKDFTCIDTSDIEMLVDCVDEVPLPLDIRWTYALSPFDHTNAFMLQELALQHARKGRVIFSLELLDKFESHVVYSPYGNPIVFDYLETLERSARFIAAWLWLARRFPDLYEGASLAMERRDELATQIERTLRNSSQRLVREAMRKANKRKRKAEAAEQRKAEVKLLPEGASNHHSVASKEALDRAERKRLKRLRKRKRRAERKRLEAVGADTSSECLNSSVNEAKNYADNQLLANSS